MSAQLSSLTAKQTRALPLLASGMPAVHVAATIGVSEQTISGWQKDENFVACLELARRDAIGKANSELQLIALAGVHVLADLLHSAKSESVRLKAAQYVCDRTLFDKSSTVPNDHGREVSPGEIAYLRSVEEHRAFREIAGKIIEILEADEPTTNSDTS